MRHTVFTGAATAIITPFAGDGIDYDAMGRMLDWQISEGIDGIVAAIMALDRCIRHERQGSVYDERGLLVF